jgi:hypothetical protein
MLLDVRRTLTLGWQSVNNKPGTLFNRGCCWTCGTPLLQISTRSVRESLVGENPHAVRHSHFCSPRCLLTWLDFVEYTELEFLLHYSRWSGGAGFRTL